VFEVERLLEIDGHLDGGNIGLNGEAETDRDQRGKNKSKSRR
jgi:hypothetical protein